MEPKPSCQTRSSSIQHQKLKLLPIWPMLETPVDKSLALSLGAVLGFHLEQKFVPLQDALSYAPETRKDFLTISLYFLFQP